MGSTMGRRLLIMTRAIDEARLIVTFGSGSGPGARRGPPAPPGAHPSDGSAQGGCIVSPGLCVSRRTPPPRPGYVFMYLLRWADDAPEFLPKLVLLRGGLLVSRAALLASVFMAARRFSWPARMLGQD